VNNSNLVNKSTLKELGAAGILDAGGGNFQIIFGVESDRLKDEILNLMSQSEPVNNSVEASAIDRLRIYSPIAGKVVSLDQVPDDVFASGTLGKGYAVEPLEGVVTAPFDGTIMQMFRTGHAVGLQSDNGIEILIHVGIDTVLMKGEGFNALVKKGDKVKRGDKLIEFNLELVREKAKSTISPIVITNSDSVGMISTEKNRSVKHGERLFDIQS